MKINDKITTKDLIKNKNQRNFISLFLIFGISIFFLISISHVQETNALELKTVRIGYFPNINHAQAVIGLGNGTFQSNFGEDIDVKTFVFNAGPTAMEALFAKQIDIAYVGPNPAINAYIVSDGEVLRIISGVSSGGAIFVVRNDSNIETIKDFDGKKFGTPQLGNTQDVALKKYLLDNGYKTKEKGGTVEVLPIKNPDIFTLMLKKELDGAWVPEPWGEKLIKEANSRIFIDERDLWKPDGKFTTGLIVVRTDFLQNNPDIIKKLLESHVKITDWINANKEEAIKKYNVELKKLTGQTLPEEELKEALNRLELTYDPLESSLYKSAEDAFTIGFLKKKVDPQIFDLGLLQEVLKENSTS